MIWVGSALLVLAVLAAEPTQAVLVWVLTVVWGWLFHNWLHASLLGAANGGGAAHVPSPRESRNHSPKVSGRDGRDGPGKRPFGEVRRRLRKVTARPYWNIRRIP